MQATVTLSTTSFTTAVGATDDVVQVASTAGIAKGLRLFAITECMQVVALTGIGNGVKVLRGCDGTSSQRHATNETVYIARGDQLYANDPMGVPPDNPLVSPRINVISGNIWVTQGDDVGPGRAARTWQKQTTTQAPGDLGIRVTTTTTPS